MLVCPGCHRHVRLDGGACPFCGHHVGTTRLGLARAFTLALGLSATACAERETDSDDDGAESMETGLETGEESGTSTTGGAETTGTTTAGTTGGTTTETTGEESSTTESWESEASDYAGPEPEFDCGDGEYIYEWNVCDGYADCTNGYDESEEVCGSPETSDTDETTN